MTTLDRLSNLRLVVENEQDFSEDKELLEKFANTPFPRPLESTLEGDDLGRDDLTLPKELELSNEGKILKKVLHYTTIGSFNPKIYDHFLMTGIPSIISSKDITLGDGSIVSFELNGYWKPTRKYNNTTEGLFPKDARKLGLTYSLDVMITAKKHGVNVKTEITQAMSIAQIPLMTRSRYCYLYGMNDRQLIDNEEDPARPYCFVINGADRLILLQEQLSKNRIFVFRNNKTRVPICRLTVLTPKGSSICEISQSTRREARFKGMIELHLTSHKKVNNNYQTINVLRVFRVIDKQRFSDYKAIHAFIAQFIKPEERKRCLQILSVSDADFVADVDDDYLIGTLILSVEEEFYEKIHATWERRRKAHQKVGPEPIFKSKGKTPSERGREAFINLIENECFPHIKYIRGPDGESKTEREQRITEQRLSLYSLMIVELLRYLAGFRGVDDRNHWGNKGLNSAGPMMDQLFRATWRKALTIVQSQVDSEWAQKRTGLKIASSPTAADIMTRIISNITTTVTYESSFSTGRWGIKGTKQKKAVAQIVPNENITAALALSMRIDVPVSRTDRQPGIREVPQSAWGFVCPIEASEGENCGILKALAITVTLTTDKSEDIVIAYLLGLTTCENIPFFDYQCTKPDKLMLNGKFIGWCEADTLEPLLRKWKINNYLYRDTSIVWDRENHFLYIHTEAGRIVRPVLVVENNALKMETLGLQDASFEVLIQNGCVEYISPWEQETMKIAVYRNQITSPQDNLKQTKEEWKISENVLKEFTEEKYIYSKTLGEYVTFEDAKARVVITRRRYQQAKLVGPFTHCECDPCAMFGISVSLIPAPGTNPGPRNLFQSGMGKQGMGIYHVSWRSLLESGIKLLAYPARSIFETYTAKNLGQTTHPQGQTVQVMFGTFLGQTQEDSFIIKKEAVQFGFGLKFKTLSVITEIIRDDPTEGSSREKAPDQLQEFLGRSDESYSEKKKYLFRWIDAQTGLPPIGAEMSERDYVIGSHKKIKQPDGSYKQVDTSKSLKVGQRGRVYNISIVVVEKKTIVKVFLITTRYLIRGDKASPRDAQKGTIGRVENAVNMPKSMRDGIAPDFIASPIQIPSRSTMSYPIEILGSKYGALQGERVNGTAFQDYGIDNWMKFIRQMGYNYDGKEKYEYRGKVMEGSAYTGSVFIQTLKHEVTDKIAVRGIGARRRATNQPTVGRSKSGGNRTGHMELYLMISYGMDIVYRESTCDLADRFESVVCGKCSNAVPFVKVVEGSTCKICGNTKGKEDYVPFGRLVMPFVTTHLNYLLGAMGMRMNFKLNYPDMLANELAGNNVKIESHAEDEDLLEFVEEGESEEEKEKEEKEQESEEAFISEESGEEINSEEEEKIYEVYETFGLHGGDTIRGEYEDD